MDNLKKAIEKLQKKNQKAKRKIERDEKFLKFNVNNFNRLFYFW